MSSIMCKCLAYLDNELWDSEELLSITQRVIVRNPFFKIMYEIERCTTTGDIMEVKEEEVIFDDTRYSGGDMILRETLFCEAMESLNLDQYLFDMDEDEFQTFVIVRGILREIDYKYCWKDEPYYLTFQLVENIVNVSD